jgi:hypothetical protein
MKALRHRYGCACSGGGHLTDTQLAVLRLIAAGRNLGEYVPAYRPGARRGRGAFPVTIAARAAEQLRRKGLAVHNGSRWSITPEGQAILT